jgi:hypothetical protein
MYKRMLEEGHGSHEKSREGMMTMHPNVSHGISHLLPEYKIDWTGFTNDS